ncbi:NnrS family protein [Psychrobium sp. 1_MG-2023]|uniref:NnrS family protein n=1 Tax=Psychrobium sp. 1_MG-2023 TaxID=3062624 RepID=UPI000C32B5C4|nr:NnrS family protein [Psychrobium sp. 1_MG-2023]MDP2561643.1 NnrS family protein [Psychrobium sp. 1_MG-2023]PKF55660.1 NnrS family protein [Alteromonadales bacterium alter-6D02]
MNISEPITTKQPDSTTHPLWQLAFRSFFLSATLASAFSLIIWLLLLNGYSVFGSQDSQILPGTLWHTHEMLFGFAATVAVGFILTASQTWTGRPSLSGRPIIIMMLLWLSVRAGLFINTENSVSIAIIAQSLWWLIAIVGFTHQVVSAKNRRNYLFVFLLTALALANLSMLILAMIEEFSTALHLAKSAVLMFTLLMGVVGGRVIPFFTARGANTPQAAPHTVIELMLLPVSVLGITFFIMSGFVALPFTPAPLMILAGLLHLLRMSRWYSLKTIAVPLLWSLHLSYLMMALGLIALGVSYFSHSLSFSNALHVITLGAIANMIFAMMGRVSLGHTGRALTIKPAITVLFILMVIAAVVRVLLPLLDYSLLAWNISASLWVISSLIFLFVYWPILTSPRQ